MFIYHHDSCFLRDDDFNSAFLKDVNSKVKLTPISLNKIFVLFDFNSASSILYYFLCYFYFYNDALKISNRP